VRERQASAALCHLPSSQSRWKERIRWIGFQREITPKIVSNQCD
jgi:hypothetical protein